MGRRAARAVGVALRSVLQARPSRLGTVAVAGESMLPALRPGDFLLVWRSTRIRRGDVVVAERPDRPGLLVVKRAAHEAGEGWWVLGDNSSASDDSRVFGPVVPVARVVCRYWPLFRRS